MLFFTDIIHRFGIPNVIITDNGTQFTGKKFLDFCDRHHIRVNWSAHGLFATRRALPFGLDNTAASLARTICPNAQTYV